MHVKSYWLQSEIVSGVMALCAGRISDSEKDSDSDSDSEMASDPLLLSSASESPDMVFELAPEGYAVEPLSIADCASRISDSEKDSDSDSDNESSALDALLLSGADASAPMTFELLPSDTVQSVAVEG